MLLPFFHNKFCEAGIDEAGRGCFAGPVFAAAVVLPKDFYHPLLNDSKQLTKEERNTLRPVIEKESVSYSVARVDNEEIDQINILQASFKAMHIALDKLKSKPQLLLVDGNRFRAYSDLPHKCVIKGDGMYSSIAAASVLAKTYRSSANKTFAANKNLKRLSMLASVLLLIQIVLGTQVREQIDHISSQLKFTQREIWISKLNYIFYIHRTFSILIAGVCVYLFLKYKKFHTLKTSTWLILTCVFLNIVLGVIMAYFNVPSIAQPLHLLLSSVLITAVYYNWLRTT